MRIALVFVGIFFSAVSSLAQEDPQRTLITNVHVFDGVNEARMEKVSSFLCLGH